MNQNNIELINVTREFGSGAGRIRALSDVTLTIGRGEFVGVLGLNASGKSTLARLLNGLIRPTAGRVLVGGLDTADPGSLPVIRRQVGMVWQSPANQIVSSIVEEDVAFGPENLRLPPAQVRERVDWALAAVGLTDLRRHAPHLLSGGQLQRVAIASVLAMRPAHLVLDEPAAMLDAAGREALLATLAALHAEHGLTVILISHNVEDVAVADRIIVLDRGAVLTQGNPARVFAVTSVLAGAGLEPPGVVRLAEGLRRRGYPVDDGIVTAPGLAEYLCRS